MEVDCEGCAGCCVDWRAHSLDDVAPERTGDRRPLDDGHNFVPLERSEVRRFLDDGLGDVMTPRLWTLPRAAEREGESGSTRTVEIDGHRLAAIDGRPVFYVGLRKPPKPVAPVGREEASWLPTCVFLDPETLQCRVHGDEHYPEGCAAYPGYNLLLEQETECERVEAAGGGERLLDDEPPTDPPGVGLGPQSLGSKLFAHPEPAALEGRIDRIAGGEATDEDRARFVGVAAASSPGTLAVAEERRADAAARARSADSWAGRAIDEWTQLAGDAGDPTDARSGDPAERASDRTAADPSLAVRVERARGAPSTPGWE